MIPPPYEPALLREHAYYDTNILQYVITPYAYQSRFTRVTEKGLGLFTYSFDKDIIYPRAVRINAYFDFGLFVSAVTVMGVLYFIYHYCTKKRVRSRVGPSSPAMLLPPIEFSSSSFDTDLEHQYPDLTNSPIHSDAEDDFTLTPKSILGQLTPRFLVKDGKLQHFDSHFMAISTIKSN